VDVICVTEPAVNTTVHWDYRRQFFDIIGEVVVDDYHTGITINQSILSAPIQGGELKIEIPLHYQFA
jgi:hypothetical protein